MDLTRAVDLCGGPGGWALGLRWAAPHVHEVGVEWGRDACLTRRAAGFDVIRADIRTIDARRFDGWEGQIASPPCPAFSKSGKGGGVKDMPVLLQAAHNDGRTSAGIEWNHHESELSLLPLQWALDTRPEWIAWEQVPGVLPLWEVCASTLRRHGYSTATGILEAERYGVPQTRERAFLIANRTRAVQLPTPTHQRYVYGEPARHEVTMFGELLPWVSMAEALGLGFVDRPSTPIMSATPDGRGGGRPLDGGAGARAAIAKARDEGRWVEGEAGFPRRNDRDDGGEYRERDLRGFDQPAFAVTEKARSWTVNTGCRWEAGGDRDDAQQRSCDAPAPTVSTRSGRQWILNPGKTATQPNRRTYPLDEPAPTIAFGHDAANWVWERPATTIACDYRVFPPGGHMANDGRDNDKMVGRPEGAIKIDPWQAGVLQSFPSDYPFQGTRTSQFAQCGDAVPPLLAEAVLRAAIGDYDAASETSET